jgi:hypothetical protein
MTPQDLNVYDYGQGWAMEQMLSRRVMADSVLLPNGRVIILNGEQGRDDS